MRYLVAAAAMAGAVAIAACSQAPQTNAADDLAAVNALRNSFITAMNSGNAEAIGNLYTADAVSAHNHDKTVTGRDAIVQSQRNMFSQFSVKMDLTVDETKTMGDFGFDRGQYKMAMTPKAGGNPMLDEGRYLVLLQKEADGSWKVSRDIDNSTMPMPAPAGNMDEQK